MLRIPNSISILMVPVLVCVAGLVPAIIAYEITQRHLAASDTRLPGEVGLGVFVAMSLLVGLVYATARRSRNSAIDRERWILDSTLRSLSEGVIVADRLGRFLHVNEAARKMIGEIDGNVPPSEWSQRFGYYLPDGKTLFPSGDLPLARAMRGEEVRDAVVLVRRGPTDPGLWLNVSGSPLLDHKGARRGGVIVFRDVTGSRQSLALQERLFNAVEQTEDVVFITDRSGTIEYVNRAFVTTTGYSKEEALGQTPRLLRSGRHDRTFYEKLWTTILRGEVHRGQVVNRRKEGSTYYSEQTVTPMRDASGRMTHFVSVCKDVTERRRIREQELEMHFASLVQAMLYPRRPPRREGVDIAGAVFPAAATGGDYFDFIELPGDALGIAVGDVSGHGFGPAVIMAEVRAYLRAVAGQTSNLGEVFNRINGAIAPDLEAHRYVTLLLASLDVPNRTIDYINAGHPPGYLLDGKGAVKSVLESSGPPLGLFTERPYERNASLTAEPNDTVVFFTDGITESESASGEHFGAERLIETVRAHRLEPAQTIVNEVHRAVRRFQDRQPQTDDIALVICRFV